jgi:hypothetical protein
MEIQLYFSSPVMKKKSAPRHIGDAQRDHRVILKTPPLWRGFAIGRVRRTGIEPELLGLKSPFVISFFRKAVNPQNGIIEQYQAA